MQNILAALFERESEGFQAITELRQKPVTDQYAILQMGLVKREGNDIRICDSFESGTHTDEGAAVGGLLVLLDHVPDEILHIVNLTEQLEHRLW